MAKTSPKPKAAHQNKGKVPKNNATAKTLKKESQGVGGPGAKDKKKSKRK